MLFWPSTYTCVIIRGLQYVSLVRVIVTLDDVYSEISLYFALSWKRVAFISAGVFIQDYWENVILSVSRAYLSRIGMKMDYLCSLCVFIVDYFENGLCLW